MYEIAWDEGAKAELAALTAFWRRIIIDTVERQLRYQPDVETRHRKPLREHLNDLPDATWELRVQSELRVLYWIADQRTVAILRVILKGGATLAGAVERGRKP